MSGCLNTGVHARFAGTERINKLLITGRDGFTPEYVRPGIGKHDTIDARRTTAQLADGGQFVKLGKAPITVLGIAAVFI
jgi:hypothetical protein